MRTVKLSIIFLLGVSFLLLNGCNSELQDLRIRNQTQSDRIDELTSELGTMGLQLDQLKRKLTAAQGSSGIEIQTLQQEIAALEEDIAKKKELIASMQERLLLGGAALPVELSTLLEDFAAKHDMVDYDSARGMVKPGGMTPTTVWGTPSSERERPSTSGSEPKRSRHDAYESTATACEPSASSSGARYRPISGSTRSARNTPEVNIPPRTISAPSAV